MEALRFLHPTQLERIESGKLLFQERGGSEVNWIESVGESGDWRVQFHKE